MTSEFIIRATDRTDQSWVHDFIRQRWGDQIVVVHQVVYAPHELSGFVAQDSSNKHLGLATYIIQQSACELVTLDSVKERVGIGSALLDAVRKVAIQAGCSRLWCMTTNDNHHALKFYQKRGFKVAAVHADAVERSRLLKPTIPMKGRGGIPVRDEIELELNLASSPSDSSSLSS